MAPKIAWCLNKSAQRGSQSMLAEAACVRGDWEWCVMCDLKVPIKRNGRLHATHPDKLEWGEISSTVQTLLHFMNSNKTHQCMNINTGLLMLSWPCYSIKLCPVALV